MIYVRSLLAALVALLLGNFLLGIAVVVIFGQYARQSGTVILWNPVSIVRQANPMVLLFELLLFCGGFAWQYSAARANRKRLPD